MDKRGGVYEILNTVNGKRYIGSAIKFKTRWAEHRRKLRSGKHHSIILQQAWIKYGEEAFDFSPILVCAPEMCVPYEGVCFKAYTPEYNICKVAGSPLGRKATAETRAKISAIQRGKPKSAEHRRKIGDAHKGRPKSDIERAKITKSLTGKKATPEARAKMSAARIGKQYSLGYKHTPEVCARMAESRRGTKRSLETREKMSNSLLGNTRARGVKHTAEVRAKMSAAQKGRIVSTEARAKISAANKGRKLSPEHVAAMRAGHAAYYDRKMVGDSNAPQ